MEATHKNIIYQSKSPITIKNSTDYSHAVIIKRPLKCIMAN